MINTDPTAAYFLKTSLNLIVCMSLLLFMLIPKVLYLRRKKSEKADGIASSGTVALMLTQIIPGQVAGI